MVVLSPAENRGILTKTAKLTSLHSTHQKQKFGPQSPANDENYENGGCRSGKTMVYRKPGFRNPTLESLKKNDFLKGISCEIHSFCSDHYFSVIFRE